MSRGFRSHSWAIALVSLMLLSQGACLAPFPKTPKDPKGSKGATTRPSAAPSTSPVEDEKKAQTYAEAWELICHAETLSGAEALAPRQARAVKVSDWIVAHVKNKKARYWWIGYVKVKKAEREAYFRATAKAAGQDPCPLATLLFPPRSSGGGTSSPSPAPAPAGAPR